MRYQSSPGFRMSPVFFLIILNLVFFVATIISRDLIFFLGLKPAAFLSEPWTIVTSMFLHAGFGHLFGNMITLFFFGSYLSRLVGDGRFLITYFGGGILGGILFILLGSPLSIAIGASGAVYAVAGALAMLRPNLRILLYFIIPMPLWVVITVFFVVFSFIPGVAWQAHLGGMIVGLIAGYLFRKRERYYLI